MKFISYKILAIILIAYLNVASAMQVSVTIDDLPANGRSPDQTTRLVIAHKILTTLKKHHIEQVYGFINGNTILHNSDGLDVLKAWCKEGHFLSNHTFHHLDLAQTESAKYIADIQANESILAPLMLNKDYHYFRYPFLSEGDTPEKREAVRSYLAKNNYKITPVTVDFFEYQWNEPYVRCLKKHDYQSIAWLKKTYLEQAKNALTIAHELSLMLFNHDIKNILLIHINAFTAETLDDLLSLYENQDVIFITLPEALSDPVYQINPNVVRQRSYTFLNQIRLARGLKNPPIVNKLYDALPEEQLDHLCR